MNKDIKIMIELQRYKGNVLDAEKKIEHDKKSIKRWQSVLSELSGVKSSLENNIKNLNSRIKAKEVTLLGIYEKVKKLEDRRTLLQSERELKAVGKELDQVLSEQSILEEKLIYAMDELDENEKKMVLTAKELQETDKQVAADIEMLKGKISESETIILNNNEKFNSLVENLSPQVKTRFVKLLKSKGCKAVGKVAGQICSNCNFQVPAQLEADASNDDKIVICTNCGGFIYRA